MNNFFVSATVFLSFLFVSGCGSTSETAGPFATSANSHSPSFESPSSFSQVLNCPKELPPSSQKVLFRGVFDSLSSERFSRICACWMDSLNLSDSIGYYQNLFTEKEAEERIRIYGDKLKIMIDTAYKMPSPVLQSIKVAVTNQIVSRAEEIADRELLIIADSVWPSLISRGDTTQLRGLVVAADTTTLNAFIKTLDVRIQKAINNVPSKIALMGIIQRQAKNFLDSAKSTFSGGQKSLQAKLIEIQNRSAVAINDRMKQLDSLYTKSVNYQDDKRKIFEDIKSRGLEYYAATESLSAGLVRYGEELDRKIKATPTRILEDSRRKVARIAEDLSSVDIRSKLSQSDFIRNLEKNLPSEIGKKALEVISKGKEIYDCTQKLVGTMQNRVNQVVGIVNNAKEVVDKGREIIGWVKSGQSIANTFGSLFSAANAFSPTGAISMFSSILGGGLFGGGGESATLSQLKEMDRKLDDLLRGQARILEKLDAISKQIDHLTQITIENDRRVQIKLDTISKLLSKLQQDVHVLLGERPFNCVECTALDTLATYESVRGTYARKPYRDNCGDCMKYLVNIINNIPTYFDPPLKKDTLEPKDIFEPLASLAPKAKANEIISDISRTVAEMDEGKKPIRFDNTYTYYAPLVLDSIARTAILPIIRWYALIGKNDTLVSIGNLDMNVFKNDKAYHDWLNLFLGFVSKGITQETMLGGEGLIPILADSVTSLESITNDHLLKVLRDSVYKDVQRNLGRFLLTQWSKDSSWTVQQYDFAYRTGSWDFLPKGIKHFIITKDSVDDGWLLVHDRNKDIRIPLPTRAEFQTGELYLRPELRLLLQLRETLVGELASSSARAKLTPRENLAYNALLLLSMKPRRQ